MKDPIMLSTKDKISLISVRFKDSENLRKWKNRNREYFFHKEIISRRAQTIWMKKYFSDKNNFMFIVEYRKEPIGCMGFRIKSDGADIYNVILVRKGLARKGLMSEALKLMFKFIKERKIKRIYLKVLKTNLIAQAWYEKNKFKKTKDLGDAWLMEFKGRS